MPLKAITVATKAMNFKKLDIIISPNTKPWVRVSLPLGGESIVGHMRKYPPLWSNVHQQFGS